MGQEAVTKSAIDDSLSPYIRLRHGGHDAMNGSPGCGNDLLADPFSGLVPWR